ncbi:MAG: MerR family transcriptional regulator [Bacteroidetes bacterium]|nr:MerR family transcriptional regulator [Bacteroidota bacterium]
MEDLEKAYYSISETAQMFNVNTSLLRFWEKEFEIIKPYKNKKGDRYFTKKDIETIRTIYHLTKEKGYTLQGAKDALKGEKFVEQLSKGEIIQTLKNIKDFLNEIKGEL